MIPPAFDQVLEDGRSCAVRVAVPPGLMPAHGWSVAYVLDLKQFDMMRADPGGLPGLLVGLEPGVPEDRRWDYVPAGMSPDMGQSLRTAPCLTNPNRLQAVRWMGSGMKQSLRTAPCLMSSEFQYQQASGLSFHGDVLCSRTILCAACWAAPC